MDGNYHEPLDGILFVSAMVVLGITSRGQWTMWHVRETSAVSKLVITQRRRYAWTAVGQLAAAVAVLWPIWQFGVNDTLEVLGAWRQVWIGWIVNLGYLMGIWSPVTTLMTAISIYHRPAEAAKKVHGGYILTEHARQKLTNPPLVQPVAAPGMAGFIKRYWFDV